MRKINFKVRNIGSEKYLSYILDDECDFDEELLDYLDENKIPELLEIIYEEDDENDYLTYNVTGRTTVGELFEKTVNAEIVLGIVRSIASGIVNMRDLGIPVSDVILHKGFTYVNPVTYDVKMICIPIESDTSLNAEFRTFVRNLLANATFDSNEDCNYVARIINMLNVEKFTIRAFATQVTELMEAAGMQVDEDYMEVGETGVEVTGAVDTSADDTTTIDDLPEYNDVSFDDDDEDEEIDVYESEPAKPNNVFKDLDLDAEEKVASNEVDMSAFDDSALEELEIDEEIDEETQQDDSSDATQTDEAEPEPVVVPEEITEMEETAESEEPVAESIEPETSTVSEITDESEVAAEEESAALPESSEKPEQQPEEKSVELPENGEGETEMLSEEQSSSLTEIAETTEGVTEVALDEEEQIKPILVDTSDLDNLIDEPPVVKNIRVNRAKIIQKAAEDIEEEAEEKVDNPTEQIISQEFLESGEPVEPETNMNPVKKSKSSGKAENTSTGTTVELPAGMNVVKETVQETEKHSAPGAPKAMPYIVRVNTGERVMINKPVFKLGKATRGVDFSITGNGAISRVHAIISTKDTGCYLKDNKATNGTYVDRVRLEENQEVKLKNDSTITLGDEDFLFKLS